VLSTVQRAAALIRLIQSTRLDGPWIPAHTLQHQKPIWATGYATERLAYQIPFVKTYWDFTLETL